LKRRELLKIKIKALFEADNEEYGCRRMHAALVRGGERCSPELVRRLVRELGLEPCRPKPWRHSLTGQDGQAGPVPDLVNRDFTAEKPGRKMVGDITYIWTWEGWLYLVTVIDCGQENSRLGDGRQLQDAAHQRRDPDGRPQP
jgi:putative transposase